MQELGSTQTGVSEDDHPVTLELSDQGSEEPTLFIVRKVADATARLFEHPDLGDGVPFGLVVADRKIEHMLQKRIFPVHRGGLHRLESLRPDLFEYRRRDVLKRESPEALRPRFAVSQVVSERSLVG